MDKQDVIKLAQQDAIFYRQSITEEEVIAQAKKDAEAFKTPLTEEEMTERGETLRRDLALKGFKFPGIKEEEVPESITTRDPYYDYATGKTDVLPSWKEQKEQEEMSQYWDSQIRKTNLKRKGKAAEWFVSRIAAPIARGGAEAGTHLNTMFGWLADNLSTGISKLTGADEGKLKTEIFDISKDQWQKLGMTVRDLEHKDKASEFVNTVLSQVTSAGMSVIPLAGAMGSLGLAYYGAWSAAAEGGGKEGALEGAISGALTHGILGGMGALPTAMKYPAAIGFGMVTQPGDLSEKVKSGAVWAALMPGGKRVSTMEFLEAYPSVRNKISERQYLKALQDIMPGLSAKQLKNIGAKNVFESALWRVTDVVGKPESWAKLKDERPALSEAEPEVIKQRELGKVEPGFIAGERGAVMKPGVSERERTQALIDEAKRPAETVIKVEPRPDGTVDIRIVPTGEKVKSEDVDILSDLTKERGQLQELFDKGKITQDVLDSHDQLSKTIKESLAEEYETPAYQIERLEKILPKGVSTTPIPEPVKSGIRSKDFEIKAGRAAERVSKAHNENGGSTINLARGNLIGKEGYAVSLYPELTRIIKGKEITPDHIRGFVEANAELLKDPRLSVGTWYDEASGQSYLDVSATIKDKARAIALGIKYNQKAIFDLKNLEDIPTGGTGEATEMNIPIEKRLASTGGETQTLYHFSPLDKDFAVIDPHAMGKGKIGEEGKQFSETGELKEGYLPKSNWYSPESRTVEPHKWVGQNLYKAEVPKDDLHYTNKLGKRADVEAAEAGKIGWYSEKHKQGRLLTPVEAEKIGTARFKKSDKVSGKNVMEFIEPTKEGIEQPVRPTTAAGEHAAAGGWSPEALERSKTVEFIKYNGKNGEITPIIGVEAVDVPIGKNEVKAQINKESGNVTILDKGSNVKHITKDKVSKAVANEYLKLTEKINKARKKTEFPYEAEEFEGMLKRQEELREQVEPTKPAEKPARIFDKGDVVSRGDVDYEVVDIKGDKYKFKNKKSGAETGFIEGSELKDMGFALSKEEIVPQKRSQERIERVDELVKEGKLTEYEEEYDVKAVEASQKRLDAAQRIERNDGFERELERLIAEEAPEEIANKIKVGGAIKDDVARTIMYGEAGEKQTKRATNLEAMLTGNFSGTRLHKPSTIRGQFEKAGFEVDDNIMRQVEEDYTYRKVSKARGHVDKLIEHLKEAGVRDSIINSARVMDRHRLEDVVKIKREKDGTQSTVIRKDTLAWIKEHAKTKDRLPWMRKYSARWLKKQAGKFGHLFEIPQMFFERIGLTPIIYDPLRVGERAAEVMKRESGKEVKSIFKGINKKGRQRIFDFLAAKQGKSERMRKAGIEPPKLSDLTPREQLAIVKWRNFLKKYSPRILDLAKQHGVTVKEIESYFPMYTKDNIAFLDGANFYDAIARKDPLFKSLYEREINVPYELYERDAYKNADAFSKAMSNFLEIGSRSLKVKYLIDSPEFINIVGGEASGLIADWYKNIVNPNIPKFPSLFRRWAYRAYLGLNPIVTAKQAISFVDVMMVEKAPWIIPKDVRQFVKRLAKPTTTERVPEIAVADMKSKADRFLLAGITWADKVFAKGAYNRVLAAELMNMKKEGIKLDNKSLRAAVKRVSDRIDLAMGGMTRAQRPKAYRSEVGKFALMFTSTINSRFQYYIKNTVEGIQDKDAYHIAKSLTALALGAYLEAAISRMALDWSDANDMKEDIIKTGIGNIPPLAGLIYAMDSGAWMPSAAIKNISDVFKYSKRWSETGKEAAPKALFTIAEVFGLPKQVGKVYEGLEAIDKGVKVAGKKRVELDSDVDKVRALIKGKWGALDVQKYYTGTEQKQDWHKEIAKKLSKIEGRYFKSRVRGMTASTFRKNFWGYVGTLPEDEKKAIKEIVRQARKEGVKLNWTSILNYLKRYVGE